MPCTPLRSITAAASFLATAMAVALATSCSHGQHDELGDEPAVGGGEPAYTGFAPSMECSDFAENQGKLAVQRIRAMDGRCELTVKPSMIRGGKFRSYLISSTGSVIIFNSFGGGPSASNNATRSYFVFPRKIPPGFSSSASGELEIHLPSEDSIRFSPSTGRISGATGGLVIREEAAIERGNKGGVEIRSYERGLILDTGWQYGGVAHQNRGRDASFIDSVGNRCSVKVSEIFDQRDGEPYLKFKSDPALVSFLERRCAQLNLQALKERLL